MNTIIKSIDNQNEILSLINNNQNVILAGNSGSGSNLTIASKLSKILLDDFNSSSGVTKKTIVCTEPKRSYALSLAEMLSNENGTSVGSLVGYAIRFEEKLSKETQVKFITDGLLLRELMTDPLLSSYSTIIIDQVNERSLGTDLLLSLLNRLQCSKRPDLKLVMISSSTSAVKEISKLFSNCLVVILASESSESLEIKSVIPEIERVHLSNAILQLKVLGVNSIKDLQFVTSPPKESVDRALNQLYQYGAISSPNDDGSSAITKNGMAMSGFPIELSYSRMLVESSKFNSQCLDDILTLVSILSSNGGADRLISATKSTTTIQELLVKDSDHLSLINIYNSFNSAANSKEWCVKNEINFESISLIQQIKTQLLKCSNSLESSSSPSTISLSTSTTSTNDCIKKSLLSGLTINVAKLSSDGTHYCQDQTNSQLFIHQNSVLANSSQLPQCVLFSDLIDSNDKKYMKYISAIDSTLL